MNADDRTPSRQQLAACAHDIRGALTVISGYVGLLGRDDLGAPERQQALDGIEAAVDRANALIGEMLAGSARGTAGEPVDLAKLAHRAAADARATTGREVVVSAQGSPVAAGDAVALARVLENLLGNAAKYAPAGPIELTVTESDGTTVIEVADRGPGIPPQDRKRVLEPFARLPRDEDRALGTGLGLTVVRSVADALGGTVRILGREGGGTIVRVELPAEP